MYTTRTEDYTPNEKTAEESHR